MLSSRGKAFPSPKIPPGHRILFLINCEYQTSFILPPMLSRRFTSNPPVQFHQLVPSLDEFVTYVQHKVCSLRGDEHRITCQSHVSSFLSADSLDIDYDSISQTLTVAAYWSKPPQKGGWTETIEKRETATDQVEVGMLALERAIKPEDLSVGGFLAVLGEDQSLSTFYLPQPPHPSHFLLTYH